MLAKRLHPIIPPLTLREALETTKINLPDVKQRKKKIRHLTTVKYAPTSHFTWQASDF